MMKTASTETTATTATTATNLVPVSHTTSEKTTQTISESTSLLPFTAETNTTKQPGIKDRRVDCCSSKHIEFSFKITRQIQLSVQAITDENFDGQKLESASEYSGDKASCQSYNKEMTIGKISIQNECKECSHNKKIYDFLCTTSSNNLLGYIGKNSDTLVNYLIGDVKKTPTTRHLAFEHISGLSLDSHVDSIQYLNEANHLFHQLLTIWDFLNTNHIDYNAFESSQLIVCPPTKTIKITEFKGARLMLDSADDWSEAKKAENGYHIIKCGFHRFIQKTKDKTSIASPFTARDLNLSVWQSLESLHETESLRKPWLFSPERKSLILTSFMMAQPHDPTFNDKHCLFKNKRNTKNFQIMMELKQNYQS